MDGDGKKRCFGGKFGEEFYASYHDNEWGVPAHEDRYLFEMLILESAQAGLSWEIVLRKREGYREAFHAFDPTKVATVNDETLEALCQNPKIIRNRKKIFSVKTNAQVFLKIQENFGSFDRYLWQFVNNKPICNRFETLKEIPKTTKESDALSKDLKKRGMVFIGSTIMYSYMQAVGLFNDHLTTCWRFSKKNSR